VFALKPHWTEGDDDVRETMQQVLNTGLLPFERIGGSVKYPLQTNQNFPYFTK
jgi:hypothetical protein